MDTSLLPLIEQMPKAELHLHIEGSLEPEMVFALACRNGLQLPYPDVASLRQAYDFSNLQEFLDVYYSGMAVLRTRQDFYDLTWAYLQRAQQERIVHVEIFFDPQAHLERGISLATQIDGIHAALEDGQRQLGISFRLILSFLRHLSEESAFQTLEQAMPYLDRIDGFGLDSSEVGHPPEKFARLFARCRQLGFKICVHAGEEGPPDYVQQAVNLLQVDRIDHGNRALEDEALLVQLAARQIPLTLCPLSNLKLHVVQQLQQHPLLKLLQRGLLVTINSDDPAYFGGYLSANYRALLEHLPVSREQLRQLACNSFTASWLPAEDKAVWIGRINQLFASAPG
ncbi:MAG: adenosine deaminase [Desulfuromonas thiophila]|nr:adenosine deaminase [Desulfuromonas thiophila]